MHAHEPPGPHRRRADLRPARPGGAVTAPLLHGLALVWRSRLSARLRDDAADPGDDVHHRLRRWRLAGSCSICVRRWRRSAICVRCSRRAKASKWRCRAAGSCAALATGAAALLAVIIGLYAAGRWETWLTWRHGVPFGIADPILNRDVGFYVFTLPFLQLLRGLGAGLVVLAALAAGALYLLSGSLSSGFPAPHVDDASGTAPSVAARRRLPALDGVGRLAAPLRTSARDVRTDPRRQLRRRLRPHAGGAAANGRAAIVGAALAAAARVRQPELADPGRRCAVRARVDRRRGLQQRGAALRRHAQRAGARDAVHPAQHRRDAARVRARHRRASAQSRATRG